jgi:phosphohistidine phosphatase SixA
MTIFVVRHAKAGQRSDWDGEDEFRPLSQKGRRQAEALADRLADLGPTRLVTSRYTRCRQTLEPLAARLGLALDDDERLAEGASFDETLALVADMPDGAVLCSHGDVIPDLVQALERRGMEIRSAPDWRKASVWLLDRNGDGHVAAASVWPPPEI